MSDKIPLVLFSGGLDSTYLVQTCLGSSNIDTLYANGGQHIGKIELELEKRKELIEHFNTWYPHKISAQYECLISTGNNRLGYSQRISWLQAALKVINPARHSKLLVGYVHDDGAGIGAAMDDIKETWRLMQKISDRDVEPIPLEFPLIYTKKVDILREIDKRILTKVWVCELPVVDKKPCGKCNPCKLMRKVMRDYEEEYGETVLTTRLRALAAFKSTWVEPDLTSPYYSHNLAGRDFFDIPKYVETLSIEP